MAKALIFPGQGSQAPGMAKELYTHAPSKILFDKANSLLGFDITALMFEGTAEELTRTSVTQPAIFLHSVILAFALEADKDANMAAGHSLGEFSALTVAGALQFEDGLQLVSQRAKAMQEACDAKPSTMAAIVGIDDHLVEEACTEASQITNQIVVPANYNAPGQLVVSGDLEAVDKAIEIAKSKGAKIAKRIPVNGAFHSPLMQPAQDQLAKAIAATEIRTPKFPVFHNCEALPAKNAEEIRLFLQNQLTAPVRWTQSIINMEQQGANHFIEIGPGKVLQGLNKRIAPSATAESVAILG